MKRTVVLAAIIGIVSMSCNSTENVDPVNSNVRISKISYIDTGGIIIEFQRYVYDESGQMVKSINTNNGAESESLYFWENGRIVRTLHTGTEEHFLEYNTDGKLSKITTPAYEWVKTYDYVLNDVDYRFEDPWDIRTKHYVLETGNAVNVKMQHNSNAEEEMNIVYDSNPSFLAGVYFTFVVDFGDDLVLGYDGFKSINNPISTEYQALTYEYNEAGYPISLESKSVDDTHGYLNYNWIIEYE